MFLFRMLLHHFLQEAQMADIRNSSVTFTASDQW